VSSAGVVQIGKTVAESWSEVQQRCGGLAGDACVTISGAGGNAFKKTKHTSNAGHVVEGRDKMHFARARVRKTNVYAIGLQGIE
jgi:hypothetical protein